MRLLLDTHVFLWFIIRDDRLSAWRRDSIRDQHNSVYLSVVSLWEAIIKQQIGKLPLLHRDPFDRLLIAQARRHDMKLVTLDGTIRRYSVPLLEEPASE
jgi:PIN domain nuclease of toxin-antitoxin system